MATTPSNTLTASALRAAAQTTPFTPKLPDRQKGVDYYRAHIDKEMVEEDRFVEVSFDEFMNNFVRDGAAVFNPDAHDFSMDVNLLKEEFTEQASYLPLVSKVAHVILRPGSL